MCRTPEIVAVTLPMPPWWDDTRRAEHADDLHYKCVNCDRPAYECPTCKAVRCESDLWHTMFGHWPIGCKVCAPHGFRQEFLTGEGALGLGGGELRIVRREHADDPW